MTIQERRDEYKYAISEIQKRIDGDAGQDYCHGICILLKNDIMEYPELASMITPRCLRLVAEYDWTEPEDVYWFDIYDQESRISMLEEALDMLDEEEAFQSEYAEKRRIDTLDYLDTINSNCNG